MTDHKSPEKQVLEPIPLNSEEVDSRFPNKLLLENGKYLIGPLVHSYPHDFGREDEIRFEGHVIKPGSIPEYTNFLTLFLNLWQYRNDVKKLHLWEYGVWNEDLGKLVIEKLFDISSKLPSGEFQRKMMKLANELERGDIEISDQLNSISNSVTKEVQELVSACS